MLLNNLVSAGVGFVPIAGDVFLGMFKANSRNAALLEEFLRIRGEEFLKLQAQRKEVRTVDGAPGSSSGQAVVVTGTHDGDLFIRTLTVSVFQRKDLRNLFKER